MDHEPTKVRPRPAEPHTWLADRRRTATRQRRRRGRRRGFPILRALTAWLFRNETQAAHKEYT
jgi:hypothetical protein